MTALASASDVQFRNDFECGRVSPADFRHRDHLRLAYVYLFEGTADNAIARMRCALQDFLRTNGVPDGKYHETMTAAWILAVRHFMEITDDPTSFDAFIDSDPRLLDTEIMLSHYTKSLLLSDAARTGFVEPDIQDIPRHG